MYVISVEKKMASKSFLQIMNVTEECNFLYIIAKYGKNSGIWGHLMMFFIFVYVVNFKILIYFKT